MKIIKLIIVAILIAMYQIALADSGTVKAICWILLIGLSISLFARLEKLYGVDN